jgi:L-fuculose-phosphate aldolase
MQGKVSQKLKEKVVESSKKVYESGLVCGTWGNISCCDREEGIVVITPSGLSKDNLNPQDMVVLDLDGNVLDGVLKPSVETPMHMLIYKNRNDASGIIHTHSQAATSFAVVGSRIPPITVEFAAVVGGSIPIAGYAPFGTNALGRETIKALGRGKAVLLANHGVVALGKDLDEAFRIAVIVEDTAKIYIMAKNLGEIKEIPEREVETLKETFAKKYGQKKNKGR